jgi:hypothetical protein
MEKGCEQAIEHLCWREIAQIRINQLLSEPKELMGEFDDGINYIRKYEHSCAKDDVRTNWEETFYWPMIKRQAETAGQSHHLNDRFTAEQIHAGRELLQARRLGTSKDVVLKYLAFWRLLFNLRTKGATLLIIYRTSKFNDYCFRHPNSLETLLSWNKVYHQPLLRLESRLTAQKANDFSGRCDLDDKSISEQITVPTNDWRDDCCEWLNMSEKAEYLANHNIEPSSHETTASIIRNGVKGDQNRNKSHFVDLVSYEIKSEDVKPTTCKCLAICPVAPISSGDFLGTFPGQIRYTSQVPKAAIEGPVSALWLDNSQVTGKLNQMRVAEAGDETNVCLAWEGVGEMEGQRFCEYFRILVFATRDIMPFEQLVRPS